jgi:Domain of unknown function (DUF4159)
LKHKRWILLFLTMALAGFGVSELVQVLAKSCGPPPRAAPQRRKGGESFPPLPLPATPLRRTEKKRPPAPPALIGKIQYGKVVWTKDAQGRRTSFRDWTTDPADIKQLVRHTNYSLGIRYRAIHTTFASFSYNPAEIPILYLTGHEKFELDAEKRKKLLWFINDGGYLIGDACCGSKDFYEAFVNEMRSIFPNNPLRQLDADHPLFSSHHKISTVEAVKEGKSIGQIRPPIWGISVGCRTAIMMWPYDLSCGWDGHTHKTGQRISVKDARKLGVNIMAYCLANYQLGRFLSTERVFHQAGQPTRDEFVFALAQHGGDWDPAPNGIMNFLRYTRANSTLPVQFKRQVVKFNDKNILRYPVVYMTGHHEVNLTDAELLGLKNYLANGGVVFASSCCGRRAFDVSFRQTMARVLPKGAALKTLPLKHPLYTAGEPVRTVEYSPMFQARHPKVNVPILDGASIDGRLAVIYSRVGLSSQWDGQARPHGLCYSTQDGLRVGLNVLVYAMTH